MPLIQHTVSCGMCGTSITIPIKKNEFVRWQFGELIQEAMPSMSPALREMLISGVCPDCWDRMFEEGA